MPSIRQPLICVWPCSGGQNFARKKVVSKYIHYTMWKHRSLHSFISPKRHYTIQRQWNKSLMNLALTASLTWLITILRCCIRFIRLTHSSLSGQRKTCNTNPSNGNADSSRMYFQMWQSNWLVFIPSNTIPSSSGL